MDKSTRELLGYSLFPVVVFAFVFPLLGVLHTTGGLLTNLVAGIVFAGLAYGAIKLAEKNINIHGSSPRKAFGNLGILIVIYLATTLIAAAVFPSISVGSIGLAVVAAVLYPFVQNLVIGE
jgi:hypothetical protein